MQITIINDCQDQNAKLRQVSRAGAYFKNASVNCFGVCSDLEASGFLLDAIDAFEGKEGVILANVAPRNGSAHKWKNGTPFGYFWHKKTLIVSTVGGNILSLPNKFGIIKNFHIVDIEEVLNSISDKELDGKLRKRIMNSQFRSFDFLPRMAYWIKKKKKFQTSKYDIGLTPKSENKIWFIDNFGNLKTTLTIDDLGGKNQVRVKIGNTTLSLQHHECLKDLCDDETAIVSGSSGVYDSRFLEISTQGKNTSLLYGLHIGDSVEII